ncbi:MAG TPA: sulfatase [Opitutae bacterium]|nr:sulfatase [Opitutae bacterium]
MGKLLLAGCALGILSHSVGAKQTNVLWFVVDDMSADFSCFGQKAIRTPAVDKLAAEGLLFTRAYATSPVCSTFRSALITGMYQNSIGAHHHRSGRGKHRIKLPVGVRPIPELFQKAGFHTCIGSGIAGFDFRSMPTTRQKLGKTDYNFDWEAGMYDSHDWADRKKDQPFFMQVQLHGGKMRGASESGYQALEKRMKDQFAMQPTPHEKIALPPYYPKDAVLIRDWATYLDTVRITDWHVGQVMQRLEKEGVLENTLVVFFTDHGISHARGKQFLYDEGTHIPLIIRGPGISKGKKRNDLVEHIDVAALSLAAAGIEIPKEMEGSDILDANHQPKQEVFAARDRCGEATDRIRSVRTENYLYLRNFYPQRPHLMPSNYKDGKIILVRLRQLHEEKKLDALAEKLLFSPTRPAEELYLYRKDRWQIDNLADHPKHAKVLQDMRQRLDRWLEKTGDPGPETPEVYILETEDQMKSTRDAASRENYRKNSELYMRWTTSGK